MQYTKEHVQIALEHFRSESSQGVEIIDSGRSGKTIAICMCTHGNEPVGLMVYMQLKQFFLTHSLEQGKLMFILTNERALELYISATTEEEERNARYVDINMNRIPEQSHLAIAPQTYEQRRLQELYPMLCKIDIALDLHSTSLPSDPMVMSLASTSEKLLRTLPIRDVITNVEGCMGNIFFMSYIGGYANPSTETVGIECGSHYDEYSIARGMTAVLSVLETYGFIAPHQSAFSFPTQDIYTMSDQVFFPNNSYCLVREFANFEYISKGTILALGNGDPILAPYDCHTVFAFKGGKPPSLQEAALFLLRK